MLTGIKLKITLWETLKQSKQLMKNINVENEMNLPSSFYSMLHAEGVYCYDLTSLHHCFLHLHFMTNSVGPSWMPDVGRRSDHLH